MCEASARRFILAVLVGILVAGSLSVSVAAQTKGAPEKYNATAVNMGSGPGMAGRVLIAVDRWSTAAERERLLNVFLQKGADKLLDAVKTINPLGPSGFRIRSPGICATPTRPPSPRVAAAWCW